MSSAWTLTRCNPHMSHKAPTVHSVNQLEVCFNHFHEISLDPIPLQSPSFAQSANGTECKANLVDYNINPMIAAKTATVAVAIVVVEP